MNGVIDLDLVQPTCMDR